MPNSIRPHSTIKTQIAMILRNEKRSAANLSIIQTEAIQPRPLSYSLGYCVHLLKSCKANNIAEIGFELDFKPEQKLQSAIAGTSNKKIGRLTVGRNLSAASQLLTYLSKATCCSTKETLYQICYREYTKTETC